MFQAYFFASVAVLALVSLMLGLVLLVDRGRKFAEWWHGRHDRERQFFLLAMASVTAAGLSVSCRQGVVQTSLDGEGLSALPLRGVLGESPPSIPSQSGHIIVDWLHALTGLALFVYVAVLLWPTVLAVLSDIGAFLTRFVS